ncbi:MAG: hypothetical protein IPN49_15495 [Saprospiraceae bacterium]|nr:hypothetical protein [Saprospiraceae bacterium]
MDPKTTKKVKIESDPENKVDFGGLRMDRHTRKIIGTSYTLDKTKYYWKDKAGKKCTNFFVPSFRKRG